MNSYDLHVGHIKAYSPITNTYSIDVWGSKAGTYHNCMVLGEDSGRVFGPMKSEVLSPGTNVIFFACTELDVGYIVGVASFRDKEFAGSKLQGKIPLIPFANTPEDFNWPSGDSTSTILAMSGMVPNYRPRDNYPGTTAGSTSELGVGYGHTPTTSYVKASEMAGVWAFLLDHTTRMAGFNFEFWHSGGDRNIKCTNGLVEDVERSTPFLWESRGFNSPDSTDKVEIPPEVLAGVKDGNPDMISEQYRLQQLYSREIPYPDALYRHLRIKDEFGDTEWVIKQGSKDYRNSKDLVNSTGLDNDAESQKLCNTGGPSEPITTGLSKVTKALDGDLALQSAKSLSFVKDLRIPVPHQVAPPETIGSQETQDANWVELTKGALESSFTSLDYVRGELDQFEYDLPPSKELKIDPDTKETYYSSKSEILQSEDGSIILRDGYGSAIILSKGNIYLTCPGDIFTLPGRNSVTWAGKDAIVKAQDTVEVSAALKDVRIKAEKSLSLLGGNSGLGGVLVASKAKGAASPVTGENFATGGVVITSDSFIGLGSDQTSITGNTAEALFTVAGKIEAPMVNASSLNSAVLYSDVANMVSANIATLMAAGGLFGGLSSTSTLATWAGSTPPSAPPVPAPVVVSPVPTDVAPFFSPGAGPAIPTLLEPSSINSVPIAQLSIFTFRSSLELGYTPDFNFHLVEQEWQKMATGAWVEPAVNGTYPHPAGPVSYKITKK